MPTQGHFFSDFSDSKVLLKRTQHVLYFLKAVMNVMKFMKVMKVMRVMKVMKVMTHGMSSHSIGPQIQDNLLTKRLGVLWTPFFVS